MADHFKVVCSCGAVMSQCRCPGPKAATVVERGCGSCHGSKATVKFIGKSYDAPWEITDLTGLQVYLTYEDWKYVNGIIHNHYHGED
jgi:hypothetical protein